MRNLTQVSALPVCEDEDAALRACSNGLVGELFRIGAIFRKRGRPRLLNPCATSLEVHLERNHDALAGEEAYVAPSSVRFFSRNSLKRGSSLISFKMGQFNRSSSGIPAFCNTKKNESFAPSSA
jgi:hypothetical protein